MTHHPAESTPTAYNVGGDNQDELFAVLSHTHRRVVLQYLRTTETPTSIDDIVTKLVAWEAAQPGNGGTNTDRATFEVSLQHVHLPKLADAGLVEYDDAGQTVTFANETNELESHLETMATR